MICASGHFWLSDHCTIRRVDPRHRREIVATTSTTEGRVNVQTNGITLREKRKLKGRLVFSFWVSCPRAMMIEPPQSTRCPSLQPRSGTP